MSHQYFTWEDYVGKKCSIVGNGTLFLDVPKNKIGAINLGHKYQLLNYTILKWNPLICILSLFHFSSSPTFLLLCCPLFFFYFLVSSSSFLDLPDPYLCPCTWLSSCLLHSFLLFSPPLSSLFIFIFCSFLSSSLLNLVLFGWRGSAGVKSSEERYGVASPYKVRWVLAAEGTWKSWWTNASRGAIVVLSGLPLG